MLVTAGVLLLASTARVVWEARPVPPLFPPDTTAYEALIDETDALLADDARRNTPLAPGERIDPNRDPEVELARLPGVGPALATRIAASRQEEGPFRRPEDLARVPGIGDATVARLRDALDLSDPPPAPAGSVAGGGFGDALDLNRAGAAELETLPGVGPATAARIMAVRAERGGFRLVDELLEVPGIGPATLERLRPLVRVH